MELTAHPKQIGEAVHNNEHCAIVEIICPVCGDDRVEPLPSLYNDKWLCCRCDFTFTVKEKSNE